MNILNVKKINGVPIIIDLIPISNVTSRNGRKIIPTHITVHNTGNSSIGAGEDAHTEYVDNTSDYISWHLTCGDEKIYQELPLDEMGYHCSSGNEYSIGIEICEDKGSNYAIAEENAISIIIYLMDLLDIPLENVVPHQFWNGKYCPHLILDAEGGFEGFKERIKNKMTLEELKSQTPDEIINKAFDSGEEWINGCDFAEEFGKINGVGKGYILQYMRNGFKKAYLLGLEDGKKLN